MRVEMKSGFQFHFKAAIYRTNDILSFLSYLEHISLFDLFLKLGLWGFECVKHCACAMTASLGFPCACLDSKTSVWEID